MIFGNLEAVEAVEAVETWKLWKLGNFLIGVKKPCQNKIFCL